MPDKQGITKREHLLQVEKSTKRKPKDLENPHEFPRLLSHVWSFFCELQSARTAGFSGANPLSYSEIESWCRLSGNSLTPYDVAVIKQLDNTYMKAIK